MMGDHAGVWAAAMVMRNGILLPGRGWVQASFTLRGLDCAGL